MKSVSPFGNTTPHMRDRLHSPEDMDRCEKAAAKLWEKENTRQSFVCSGRVSLDLIAHQCTPQCIRGHHQFPMEHNERDVQVAAATIQWLGSNSGQVVLGRLAKELGYELVFKGGISRDKAA